jgi:hypothetical protein
MGSSTWARCAGWAERCLVGRVWALLFCGLLWGGAVGGVQDVGGALEQTSSCSSAFHRVRAGQTLASIAAAYGTTVHRIVGCNRLASYTLYVGQTLRLPARSVVRP